MSIQVSKEELNSLTDFQKEMHYINDPSEEVMSNFYKEYIKSTWHSTIPLKLKATKDGDEIVYTVNNTFHLLTYSYMRFTLPTIRIKSVGKGKIRIAWCHNVGTNIVVIAKFKDDENTYHEWDNVWADMYFQYYQNGGAGMRENHNVGIGSVQCLESWSEDVLPQYTINVEQPWFYSMDQASAFPIFYKNALMRTEHRYKFRLNVLDLLRIQTKAHDGSWVDISPKRRNITDMSKYLHIPNNGNIETPELWGRYAYISDQELEYLKSCQTERTFYIRDIIQCDAQNPTTYGSTATIELHCTNPCMALFWVAENYTASYYNNYSNYTTDTDDLYEGWDPIKTTTLKYATTSRLENMESDHFSIAEPRKHFLSSPSERGYHAYSYAWFSSYYDCDVGVVLSGKRATLSCSIANNNIFTSSMQDDSDATIGNGSYLFEPISKHDMSSSDTYDHTSDHQSPSFMTRVRLMVIKKITIKRTDDGYKFTLS